MGHICDDFEEIDDFNSPEHFERFEKSINQMIAEGLVKEILVRKPYSEVEYTERWIECPNGEIWRMISPDYPFKGLFRKVERG